MFATTTVATILTDVTTDVGSILVANLPTIFTFAVSVAAVWFVYRFIKKYASGRR